MAQPRQAPACRRGAACRTWGLAEGPATGGGDPSRGHFGDDRDRRGFRDRNQFSAVDAVARLVHGEFHALHLCLLGCDLWRWWAGLSRRAGLVGIEGVAADESVRLEQASVRHGGGGPRGTPRKAAAAMGRAEVLQR